MAGACLPCVLNLMAEARCLLPGISPPQRGARLPLLVVSTHCTTYRADLVDRTDWTRGVMRCQNIERDFLLPFRALKLRCTRWLIPTYFFMFEWFSIHRYSQSLLP